MAKANTYEWSSGYERTATNCTKCNIELSTLKYNSGREKPVYKYFYNPTYMNGDSELIHEVCEICYELIKN